MPNFTLSRRDALKLAGAGAVAAAAGAAAAEEAITPGATDVFIVVDVQNDFLPGGALAVETATQVIAARSTR